MQNIETFDYEMNKEENVVSIPHSGPSAPNIDLILWHTHLIMYAVK